MHIFGIKALQAGSPHPAVQIFIWIWLAIVAHALNVHGLLLLTAISSVLALGISHARFVQLLYRMRWILIAMFFIYAYSSPASPIWPALGAFSPVADGVLAGGVQMSRLVTVLAGLSILLSVLSPAQFMAGIYALARPLQLFGMSRDRFAVRLALTLRYAENAVPDSAVSWRHSLEQMLAPKAVMPGFIELHVSRVTPRDWLLVAAISFALSGVLL